VFLAIALIASAPLHHVLGLDGLAGIALAKGGDGGGGGGSNGGGSGHDDHGGHGGHGGDGGGHRGRGSDEREVEHFLETFGKDNSVSWVRETAEGLTVRYGDGWTETVSGSRYRLIDARGNIAADRAVRPADLKRLRALVTRR
jgi:hypothetical protein